MKNFEFEHEGQKLWYSRSVVVSLYLYTRDEKGALRILANRRGHLNEVKPNYWNVPGGYLDFDENDLECAERECFEETGVKVNLTRPCESDYCTSLLHHVDTNPTGHQNVTIVLTSFIPWNIAKQYTLTNAHAEPNEVDEVAWLRMDEVNNRSWIRNQLTYIQSTKQIIRDMFPDNP